MVSLEDLADEYGIVIFDTCALGEPLGYFRENNSLDDRKKVFEGNHLFRVNLIELVNNNSMFFITPFIFNEFSRNINYPYKKIIKRKGSIRNKNYLYLFRKIREENKDRRKLLRAFEENEKILILNEKEKIAYNDFYRKYFGLGVNYELSKTDLDLLVNGAVVSRTRNSVSIISNDFGILYLWNTFLKEEKISPKKLGFFIKKTFLDFEEKYLI